MVSQEVLGPLDGSLASHLHGEWRTSTTAPVMVTCQVCGDVRPAEQDRQAAREHWEEHASEPAAANGHRVTWYVHPAGETGKHVVRGSVGDFLAATMAPRLLRDDLPAPHRRVVQEFVDLGERREGMGSGFDWSRFELTDEVYRAATDTLQKMNLAAPGTDPPWVDSLFFRRAACIAAERGTDPHHEIRRMTIIRESAAIRSQFPDLSEAATSALRQRSARANRYDFDDPNLDLGS